MGTTASLASTSSTAHVAPGPHVSAAWCGDGHHPWGQGDVQSACRHKAAPVSGGQRGLGSSLLARSAGGSSLVDGVDVVAGEEADAPVDLPLPPVWVGVVQDLDDVPAEEGQLGAVVG